MPAQNDLKMLKVQTWAQKDEAPKQWLRPGSTVLVVCDTGCTKTLVSEDFADKLGLKMTSFPEGRAPKVCLGNSDTVTPVAGVEFWATKDMEGEVLSQVPRRRISALVLRDLPTTILMSGDDLIALRLLPPDWPNHGEGWNTTPDDPLKTSFPADRNLTEKERYTNAFLTISLEEYYALGEQEEGAQGEPMDMDKDGPDLYNSKMAIPDSVFDTDTDIKSIPGLVEGKLPPPY